MIVTGWRVALELTLGTAALGLLVAVGIWLKTGVFGLLSSTEPLLEQLVFWAAIFSGLFAFVWLMAWQRIELNEDAGMLRFSSVVTGYRWRTMKASDVTKIVYFTHSKMLSQLILRDSPGMQTVAIFENSMFATAPSGHLKEIAAFIGARSPSVDMAAALR